MPIAVTRAVSRSINNCELTYMERGRIDFRTAQAQHLEYENVLKSMGCEVVSLPELPALPDSVFVEDTAIILDEVAIMTNPGAISRQPEVNLMASVLRSYRPLIWVKQPATVDGGDVLVVGKRIFVGLSSRTNQEAVEQLRIALRDFGYQVAAVEVASCLHLKTAVTLANENTLLINPNWVKKDNFDDFHFIEIDKNEPFAANCLSIDGKVIYPANFPMTREKLEKNGIKVMTVAADELAKAEGAVTCCSLIIDQPGL